MGTWAVCFLQVADGNENRQSRKTSQLMGLKFISLPGDQYVYYV
jgi:hypothetical protein